MLVGQRLTRAFSRKRKAADQQQQRRRTSSFVDGEATAPLVPSKPFPRTGKAQGSAAMSEIFTYQTTITLLAYSFIAFHSVAYDQNITVFLSTPVAPRTPDNYKLPFYFNGGFGLDPGTIGTIFTIYGVTSAAVQFILYPALVARFGVLHSFRFCCKLHPRPYSPFTSANLFLAVFLPLVYFLTPFASLFETARARFIAIIGVMIFKAFCIIIAFPSTTILLTNSCTSLRILSSLNGFATMFSALCRAIGPASTGWVFSWGARNGYIVSAYFFLGIVGLIGAIPGFMIVEGEGPTARGAATAAAEEDGDSENSSMQDSGVLLPNESAVGSSDDEDDDGETRPLISSERNRGTKYRSITGR